MHAYTPANLPGLLPGWEIDFWESVSGNYIVLSLWRVVAYLKPYQETRSVEDALNFSCSRYADAELPVGYTQEDLEHALQELVCKAEQLDEMVAESYENYNLFPRPTHPRPTLEEYRQRRYV